MLKRTLCLDQLPSQQSIFLWGARQTGKSCYLQTTYPNSYIIDLLDTQALRKYTHSPYLLREEIMALPKETLSRPVIIDEIQKIPELLNEVHWLIEHASVQFILCGSSARKLKTLSTNLLGGRAWPFYFYPLTYAEIPQFDLLTALQHGLIPKHYLAAPEHIHEHLRAYVDIFLTDEIRNEGLVRNLQGFSQFLEVAGLSNGEMINASNIARDCGVNRVTVKEYYQILIDTLLGYYIYPYRKKIKRDLITRTPKFYLFDVGIANHLAQQPPHELRGSIAGRSFEQFILMELMAHRGLHRKQFDIHYWRTKSGLEVDFILGKAQVAIEIKISRQVHQQDLKGLIAFCQEHPQARAIVVSQDLKPRRLHIDENLHIEILPWQKFLQQLAQDQII